MVMGWGVRSPFKWLDDDGEKRVTLFHQNGGPYFACSYQTNFEPDNALI